MRPMTRSLPLALGLALAAAGATALTPSFAAGVDKAGRAQPPIAAAPATASDGTDADAEPARTTLSVGVFEPAARSSSRSSSRSSGSSALPDEEAIYKYLDCNFWVDDPHYSDTAPGVIAKVKYDCPTGNTSATLVTDAYIYRWKEGDIGPYSPRASNLNVTRTVSPGASGVVYVPARDQPGILCNLTHWYNGKGYLTLSYGPSVDSGWANSNTVHPRTCT